VRFPPNWICGPRAFSCLVQPPVRGGDDWSREGCIYSKRNGTARRWCLFQGRRRKCLDAEGELIDGSKDCFPPFLPFANGSYIRPSPRSAPAPMNAYFGR
jgi:hypothetical protein